MSYAKGEKPRNLDAACGGAVIGKLSKFSKDNDLNPMGTGAFASDQVRDQTKASSGDSHAKRTGDKCLPVIKPRQ